jgi:hypothetical protein
VKRLLVVSCALGAGLVTRPVPAQVLRGVVRDSTSRLPIAGVVVTTYDSAGRTGRRSLTNEGGAYFVTAPAAARRLRVVRLGYRPVDVPIPAQRDSIARLDVVMVRIPYTLQPMRVVSGANCSRRSDRAAAMSLLEDARAGLLATVVARSERPARMKRLMVDRRLDARSQQVTRHRVRIENVPSATAAFGAARSAADFVRHGFAMETGEGATFQGPDADVLLDDAFASGYCFHLMATDRSRVGQVGLGFRAANTRRGRIDVDGALWVDTVARALVDIEYRYVGLDPELTRYEPGGRVAFRALPNGVVLIDRWMLRLVGVEVDTVRRPFDQVGRGRETAATRDRAIMIGEVGGELARAVFEDGLTWVASLGTLALTVMDDRGAPRAGVNVRLDDTDYEATTDSAGKLEIVDLVPGSYSATIADKRLEPIDILLATPLSFAAARGQTVMRVLRAPTAEDYVADRCLKERKPVYFDGVRPPRPGFSYLIGRVFSPDKQPVAGVWWTLSERNAGRLVELMFGFQTGSDGMFVYCGLAVDSDILIEFRRNDMLSGSIARRVKDPLTVIATQMDPEPKKRK